MLDAIAKLKALSDQLEEAKRGRDAALGLYHEVYLKNRELEEKCRKLEGLCNTDQLTEIGNRRHLIEEWRRVFSLMERNPSRKDVILLLDVDSFKKINTRFGYPGGDNALVLLAKTLTSSTRPADVVARLGGDEFVVILEETSKKNAIQQWLRVNERFSKKLWETFNNKHEELFLDVPIGTSCGIVEFQYPDIISWIEEGETRKQEGLPMPDSIGVLLAKAEECLQQSKLNGKNQATWKDEGHWNCESAYRRRT